MIYANHGRCVWVRTFYWDRMRKHLRCQFPDKSISFLWSSATNGKQFRVFAHGMA